MRALVAMLTGLLLTACMDGAIPVAWNPPEPPSSAEPPPSPPPPPPPPLVGRAGIVFEPADARALSVVREVHVDLALSGVRGQGTLDVEFIAPGLMPYEKRTAAVEALPSEQRSLRFTLPVAGTVITSSRLSGPWEVRFFLDGAPLTVADFTLEP
jgi:hypothetical protein